MLRIKSNIFLFKLRSVIIIFFLIATFSCNNLKKYEHYSGVSYRIKPKPDEIYLSPSLKKCLGDVPYCSMIFSKIISHQYLISKEEEDYYTNYLYSAIINKLSKNNLVVNSKTLNKDRFFLNQASIYDSLKITNEFASDLMIDFVDFKYIDYETTKIIPDTSIVRQEIIFPKTLYYRGQSLMFKITHILTGEIIGNFIFNYTPCANNACNLIYNKDNSNNINSIYYKRPKSKINSKIDTDENSKIFEELLSRFISELLKYRSYSEYVKTYGDNQIIIKLSPNPSSGIVIFESNNDLSYEVTINTLFGENVYTGNVRNMQNLSLTMLPEATYIVMIRLEGRLIDTECINIIH
jgi:hypothetical protein